MRAVLLNGPQRLDWQDQVADPEIAPDETIIAVDAVGICGSDMHAFHGRGAKRKPGLILGHEVAGRAISGPFCGQRVAINPLIHCQACRDCRNGDFNHCQHRTNIGFDRAGGFAERISLPTRNLLKVHADMDPVQAALAEPCATCLHGVMLAQRASLRPLFERDSLVLGGGAIGLLSALWLRALGCPNVAVAETNAKRRALIARAGFRTLDPADTEENHFELVIDCVGSTATRGLAVRSGRAGAIIVHIGLLEPDGDFPAGRLTRFEMQFIASWCSMPQDLTASIDALKNGILGPLDWVETRPLSEAARTFHDLSSGAIASPKVVLLPN